MLCLGEKRINKMINIYKFYCPKPVLTNKNNHKSDLLWNKKSVSAKNIFYNN